MYIFEHYLCRARVGPGLDLNWTSWPGPGPAESGPDLKGQGQGQQNQPRASPDLPVDSLEVASSILPCGHILDTTWFQCPRVTLHSNGIPSGKVALVIALPG